MKTTEKKSLVAFVKHHIHSLLAIEIIIGMLLSIGSFVVFATLSQIIVGSEWSIDVMLAKLSYQYRHPFLTDLMLYFSFIGNEVIFFASIVIVAILLVIKRTDSAMLFGFTVWVGYALNDIIKNILQVPRPLIDPLITEVSFRFPSGHSMNSFIFFSMLTYLTFSLTRNKTYTIVVGICSSIVVLLIGFSRIYLGVHFPSDVIAGYIAGFWWVVTAILLDRALRFYHLYRSARHKTL